MDNEAVTAQDRQSRHWLRERGRRWKGKKEKGVDL
jgi:hypothetical protein